MNKKFCNNNETQDMEYHSNIKIYGLQYWLQYFLITIKSIEIEFIAKWMWNTLENKNFISKSDCQCPDIKTILIDTNSFINKLLTIMD